MACANVNCSLDYSLGEITAIMLCFIDEEGFFSKKSPLNDPIRHQLVNLTPATMPSCFRTHGCTIKFNNIGLLAENFKFNFAKKSKFKTGGLEYH